MEKSIEHKYREGNVKRTLIKELKELETTQFNQNALQLLSFSRFLIFGEICESDNKIPNIVYYRL